MSASKFLDPREWSNPGASGLEESRDIVGDKVIDDGLHAGWFERIEQSYYRILDAFADAISKGT